MSGRGIVFPRIDQQDAGGLKVGGIARGEREVVDLGGGGEERVLIGRIVRGPIIGGLFGDSEVHIKDVESPGLRDEVIIPRGEVRGENGITLLYLSHSVAEFIKGDHADIADFSKLSLLPVDKVGFCFVWAPKCGEGDGIEEIRHQSPSGSKVNSRCFAALRSGKGKSFS